MSTVPTPYQILSRQEWQGRTVMVIDEGEYRSLYFDNQMTQSRMALASPLWLVLPYTRHMLACLLFNQHPKRLLMIGLGGGSLVKFFLHYYPECQTEVVEVNPAMEQIARRYFFLPTTRQLTLHCTTGEAFVAARAGQAPLYDLILVDAFDHDGMSPSVYSSPFFTQLSPLLSENGVLAFNLNRAETERYPVVIEQVVDHFPGLVSRLAVAGPSRNEILFCHHHGYPATHLSALQQQSATWDPSQPDLDFDDFAKRLLPIKQVRWKRWINRLHHYRNRFSLP